MANNDHVRLQTPEGVTHVAHGGTSYQASAGIVSVPVEAAVLLQHHGFTAVPDAPTRKTKPKQDDAESML